MVIIPFGNRRRNVGVWSLPLWKDRLKRMGCLVHCFRLLRWSITICIHFFKCAPQFFRVCAICELLGIRFLVDLMDVRRKPIRFCYEILLLSNIDWIPTYLSWYFLIGRCTIHSSYPSFTPFFFSLLIVIFLPISAHLYYRNLYFFIDWCIGPALTLCTTCYTQQFRERQPVT